MVNLSRVKDSLFKSNSKNAIIIFNYMSRIRDKEDNNNQFNQSFVGKITIG